MPRPPRRELPGGFYYVTAEGNRRQPIFLDSRDQDDFLTNLATLLEATQWKLHAYLLLPGAYHLLIETPRPNLTAGMQRLQNHWTKAFNRRHRLTGRLFADRYRSMPIEADEPACLLLACASLHAHGKKPASVLRRSSFEQGYALDPAQRPAWLTTQTLFAAANLSDHEDGRAALLRRLSTPDSPPEPGNYRLDRGWYFGSRKFALHLHQTEPAGSVDHHRRERGEIHAAALLAPIQADARWAQLLTDHPSGSHPAKIAVAQFLRQNSTASLGWIALELGMKSPANVCRLLRGSSRTTLLENIPAWLRPHLEPLDNPSPLPSSPSEPLPTWLL